MKIQGAYIMIIQNRDPLRRKVFEVVDISYTKDTVELYADIIILLEINNKTLTISSRELSICTRNTIRAALFALIFQLLPWFTRFRAVVSSYL